MNQVLNIKIERKFPVYFICPLTVENPLSISRPQSKRDKSSCVHVLVQIKNVQDSQVTYVVFKQKRLQDNALYQQVVNNASDIFHNLQQMRCFSIL